MARTEEEEEFFQVYDENLFGPESFKLFEENCCMTTQLTSTPANKPNHPPASEQHISRLQEHQDEVEPGSGVSHTVPSQRPSLSKRSKRKRRHEGLPGASPLKTKQCLKEEERRQQTPASMKSSLSGRRMTRSALKELNGPVEDVSAEDTSLNALDGVMTEETLLIKSNRLISIEEVQQEWIAIEEETGQGSDDLNLQRSARKARATTTAKLDADTLSDAAYDRVLRKLELGEAPDLESAIMMEKMRLKTRRSRKDAKRRRGAPSNSEGEGTDKE